MLYRTMVALQLKGDRVEKGAEIELSKEEAAALDPSDITPVAAVPEPEPEEDLSAIPLEDMTLKQLQARAKELELSASGSKADLEERIRLHLDGADGTEEEDEEPGEEDGADGTEEEELSDNND